MSHFLPSTADEWALYDYPESEYAALRLRDALQLTIDTQDVSHLRLVMREYAHLGAYDTAVREIAYECLHSYNMPCKFI